MCQAKTRPLTHAHLGQMQPEGKKKKARCEDVKSVAAKLQLELGGVNGRVMEI